MIKQQESVMTVTSLWKALDRAGCGKAVGVDDMVDHHGVRSKVNPWNINKCPKPQAPTLAIDLSIWICESLTSSVIAENHSDPTMHLVFTRTLKLLNLGVKVVGVLDASLSAIRLISISISIYLLFDDFILKIYNHYFKS